VEAIQAAFIGKGYALKRGEIGFIKQLELHVLFVHARAESLI
jgi:hypothetical protein